MLEGLAAWVLNTYVGEYIENLNTDQLSIGLLQGEVELENLPLKKDAFKSFNLPIQVLSGYIGKIKLKIPIRHLRSEPWVISLENLYIVIAPLSANEHDEECMESLLYERKLAQLDNLEQHWRIQLNSNEEPSYYSTSYSSWLSYGSSFVSNIVDNIQLKIKDVHIRYEDSKCNPEYPFSCGIILNSLSAQSTDEKWVPKYLIEDGSNISRKLVELKDLAIYWDTECELLGHLERDEFNEKMEILSDTSAINLHNYVLEPVCSEAKLTRNCQPEPLRSLSTPRINCDLFLDRFPLTLTDTQFKSMVLWVKELERLEQNLKHSKYRPKCSVKEEPKKWWNYAINYHLEEIQKRNQRKTWTFLVQRSRDIILYARAYKLYLSGSELLSMQMKAHKASVERELSFEELQIIRETVVDRYSREILFEKMDQKSGEKSGGLLKYWFPSWTGWYSTAVDDSYKLQLDTVLEKEIFDVFTENDFEEKFNKKDLVYFNVTACLRQGTLNLIKDSCNEPGPEPPPVGPNIVKKSVFELEFGNLTTKYQQRSRNNSKLFHLNLGSIYVKDKVTPDTAFPNLISPQSMDSGLGSMENAYGYASLYGKLFNTVIGSSAQNTNDKSLFDIIYEIKPMDSTADYKLHITSRSLDIVYCPSAIQKIHSFFSSANLLTHRKSELKFTAAAKMRYENLKRQTKDEIKNTFEQFLENDFHNSHMWDLLFNISAPQIIVPSNFTDRNATLVVFDFGMLHFTSSCAQIKKKDIENLNPDSDDDDDFHTPCSTPPQSDDTNPDNVDGIDSFLSLSDQNVDLAFDTSIYDKMYDKYTLKFCDLQVLVGRICDNWKYAHTRGTSAMHVIDRFSISLQLERLVVPTSNPQWPTATLSGSLPKLIVHINESKIQAIKNCLKIISQPDENPLIKDKDGFSSVPSSFSSSDVSAPIVEQVSHISRSEKAQEDETKHLMAQFCIDQLVLQIQSRGESIAELQVTGVKTTLTKRPHDLSVNLSVHGFLLVDAMQTYGPDFELLIASHKNVSMDSISGSIRGETEPNSPISPASPSSPRLSVTSPQALKQALNNLEMTNPSVKSTQAVASPPYSCASPTSPPLWLRPPLVNEFGAHDSEALICIDYTRIFGNISDSNLENVPEALQICTVLFNNLDVIANQETIVELLGFVKRIFPDRPSTEQKCDQNNVSETPNEKIALTAGMKTEISFDFHRLNVLLLRTTNTEGSTVAQKVATATMTGAKIQATLGKDLVIEGALGGLQVIDLTPEGTTHQRIVSIGYDPVCDHKISQKVSGIYTMEEPWSEKTMTKAFSFTVDQPNVAQNISNNQINHVNLTMRMASVCYVHSPVFLNALQACASEFSLYIDQLKSSLKNAATEVAIGIVNKKADILSASFYSQDVSRRDRCLSENVSNDSIDGMFFFDNETADETCELRLDIVLQTPIIVFPKSVSSPQVLVGHLGRITITNNSSDHISHSTYSEIDDTDVSFDGLSVGCEPIACEHLVKILISNMNIYSLNTIDNIKHPSSIDTKAMSFLIDELYDCSTHGQLILHDTVLDLNVGKNTNCSLISSTYDQAVNFLKGEKVDLEMNSISSVLQITGSVVSPLQIVITKQQYQQILDSMDNLTYDDASKSETAAKPDHEATESNPLQNVQNENTYVNNFKMAVKVLFSLPELNVELKSDLGDGTCELHKLVNICLKDFLVHFLKDSSMLTSIQVSLKSLEMEDLLLDSSSDHRYLMVSHSPITDNFKNVQDSSKCSHQNWSYNLSASCPEMSSKILFKNESQLSLPNHLNTKSLFQSDIQSKKLKKVKKPTEVKSETHHMKEFSPSSQFEEQENATKTLVHINALLVDKNSPEYQSKFNCTNRFIDIDFNSLDTTINVKTWVMILDFFGIGSEEITDQLTKKTNEERRNFQIDDHHNLSGFNLKPKEILNSEIDLRIRSLSLILNKPEHVLTKANVSYCSAHLTLRSNNFNIDGQLGKISLIDLSPHASLYPERFITTGEQALNFKIFKYGTKDIKLEREFDIEVVLRMSSIYYVHTQRYQAEVMAFFQHFTQLQIILNEIRAAAVGNLAQDILPRGSRIKLDIKADSPVMVLPMSSHSPEVLVMNLGKLVVSNNFLFAGSPGSISVLHHHHPNQNNIEVMNPCMIQSIYGSLEQDFRKAEPGLNQISLVSSDDHVCLLDIMNIELEEIHLYSAKRRNLTNTVIRNEDCITFSNCCLVKESGELLKRNFFLKLQVERNLDGAISHAVPDLSIKGLISSVHFSLDVEQYKLIRGLLAYNLGEPLEEFEVARDKVPESLIKECDSESAWIGISIDIDLMNVTLELIETHKDLNTKEKCLAQIDLIRSKLSYKSFSDQSKEIDLVSQEILMSDTRFRDSPANSKPNVFLHILQPMNSAKKKKGCLQAEIHYRMSKDSACFTVLVHNMRIMGIFDWLLSFNQFIMNNPENPHSSTNNAEKMLMSPRRRNKMSHKEPSLELKLNIMDTELVVVEDASSWDTNAVILKSTAVLSYKLDKCEKPLTCSLQSLEVFSCTLGMEDETALSIIDPVTVHVELTTKMLGTMLLDKQALEVNLPNLSVRLSYYDLQMFCRILNSVPQQVKMNKRNESDLPANIEASVKKLNSLGFLEEDCEQALQLSEGKIDEAALWLTQNAEHVDTNSSQKMMHALLNLSEVEIQVTVACICLIDDCKDADIPLLELSLKDLIVNLDLNGQLHSGISRFVLSCDYYNRQRSSWEPCIEPWACSLNYTIDDNKTEVKLNATDTVNINITSEMLELYQTVYQIWTEDMYSDMRTNDPSSVKIMSVDGKSSCYRRRSPFVPYALKNETGAKLWFNTHTTTPTRVLEEYPEADKESWISVNPDQEVPFVFEGRTKIRGLSSHELKIHQIVVHLDDWKPVSPVAVDKVGPYFRYINKDVESKDRENLETRIIFHVCLEGSARKLITVKSALTVINKLKDSVELKMEKSCNSLFGLVNQRTTMYTMFLVSGAKCSVPINYIDSLLWVRPAEIPIGYYDQPIKWQEVTEIDHVLNLNRICYPTSANFKPYRMCVQISRDNYPIDSFKCQPGHNITLAAPITVYNLLPVELKIRIRSSDIENHNLKPGKEAILTSISVAETVEVALSIENFSYGSELVIPPGTKNFLAKICVYDIQNRPLVVHVRVYPHVGGSLQLFVSVPYWLVNKTGLPLLFKQEGQITEAAGQSEEHEMARSVAPLMFSFADPEMSTMCSMRLGKSVHKNGIPQWCTRFHLEKGIRVRPLRVTPYDSRPDWVYIIGVEVRVGKGHYLDTYIVTLTPRFQIENHSSFKLEVTQRFAASEKEEHHLLSLPMCTLPFHWPRIDLDQLLCVKIADLSFCRWSGGFKIDKTDSFHLNIRDQDCNIHFVHVEIILQGATFFIIFTNADKLLAPYRIDNLAEVPITFHQRDVSSIRFHTTVRPHSSLVYSWDEIMLPPYITCTAPGGSSAVFNMNKFGGNSQLSYENFIYIVFSDTFNSNDTYSYDNEDLVLDVPQGTKVILSKKEAGKRSQLWRMNMKGQLEHEGSSPPRDPRSNFSPEKSRKLVLDLEGIGPLPDSYTPLMLRKSDERRRSTQTWHFTEDGRLACDHNNMYVQAKDGVPGLKAGNVPVLGLSLPIVYKKVSNEVPAEQAIQRHRFRAGSGLLSACVTPDGPTRILQISDMKNKVMSSSSSNSNDWDIVDKKSFADDIEEVDIDATKFQLNLNLVGGLGISLINKKPEELMYGLLHKISIKYLRMPNHHELEASVKNLQIDNQLIAAECPVVLFVTPSSSRESSSEQPAIHISAARIPMNEINAEIFKHLIINVKNMTVTIEEMLLWKLMEFFNPIETECEDQFDENNYQSQRISSNQQAIQPKRYYFSILKIVISIVRLSMLTSSNLSPAHLVIKRKTGWRLMRFEDAFVELDNFHCIHPFETGTFLINSILEHYREELKGQAAKILGAIDFLGNPLGLMNDVSEGVSTLFHEGDVGGLLKNVTHGLSNSAAKVTGSLSEGLGKATLDNKHEMLRKKIRTDKSSSSKEHLVAGLKGFGHGLLGGVTSIITQTYTGAANEGVQGFISGLGKGLVGTVTKPAVGVLDLATGAASAVRDTSRSDFKVLPPKMRLPRLCLGPNGALPVFSLQQAHGQEYLYSLNDRDYSERLIAFELLQSGKEDLKILISNKMIRIISSDHSHTNPPKIVLQIPYSDLFHCKYVESQSVLSEVKHYIELTNRVNGSSPGQVALKRPQVRCNDEYIAQKVAQEINYAKTMFEELRQSLSSSM